MTQSTATHTLERFKELVGDFYYLNQAQALAHWDMQTQMPEKSSDQRGKQLVTLGKMAHELLTSDDMKGYLSSLQNNGTDDVADPDRSLIREMAEKYDKATRLPSDLVQRFDEVGAKGFGIWVKARQDNSFKHFEPVLTELVELSCQRAEAFGYSGDRYDALMNEYEKDATVADIDPLFAKLKTDLIELLTAIQKTGRQPEPVLEKYTWPDETQLTFCQELLNAIGYDFSRGRMDKSVHPFTTDIGGPVDVRITVRSKANDPTESIATALHEGGHALYEQGVDEALLGTPLCSGTSLGIHESQSRLWENNVGRSRLFWQHFLPIMKEKYFTEQLSTVDLDTFYAVINTVKPTLIRTESDEVTYNLHIMVRYEIEKDLINNRLAVGDIPDVWNQKYQDYLGITPDSDANGCLQDVHWSGGAFGYFPTYTLGNLYAAQFFHTAKQQLPELEQHICRGELIPLKQWLNKNIHHHGKQRTARQICEDVTGEPLNPTYFIDYLWDKFGGLYGISRS